MIARDFERWPGEGVVPRPVVLDAIRGDVIFRLRELRRRHGYTQRQVSELTGISETLYSAWECGTRTIKIGIHQLALICALYGMTLADFFSFDPEAE